MRYFNLLDICCILVGLVLPLKATDKLTKSDIELECIITDAYSFGLEGAPAVRTFIIWSSLLNTSDNVVSVLINTGSVSGGDYMPVQFDGYIFEYVKIDSPFSGSVKFFESYWEIIELQPAERVCLPRLKKNSMPTREHFEIKYYVAPDIGSMFNVWHGKLRATAIYPD